MTDHTNYPDYPLDKTLDLTTPEQLKAMGDPARQKILAVLGQQSATTKQLAEILGQPRGTIGHHLKVLEAAGLIRVVRTRPVRAIIEKYYGRVARVYRMGLPLSQEMMGFSLRQALDEMAPSTGPDDPSMDLIAHARIPAAEAHRFVKRVEALAEEFSQHAVPGEKVYGFVAGVYLTIWSDIPSPAGQDENDE